MKIKKIVALLLSCYLVLVNVGLAYGETEMSAFRDIKGSFAEKPINHLTGQGIIHGISADQFAPGQNVTRLQFAILMAKSLGIQPFFPADAAFSDLTPGTAEQGYVEALANLGLLKGIESKTFGGNYPVRRQDVAVILQKVLNGENAVSSLEPAYKDADKISPYAAASIASVSEKGWMKGSGGYFHPLQYLTRAEAAVIIDRLFENRRAQAQNALKRPVGQIGLGLGEVKKFNDTGIQTDGEPTNIDFTPAFGTDNLAVSPVLADGTMAALRSPASGMVTVNKGINSYPVAVNVYSKTGGYFSPDQGLTDPRGEEQVMAVAYSVYQQSPDTAFKKAETTSYPGPPEGITSGSDTWTGFLRQRGRDIVVDLKTLNTISSLSMEFKQDSKSAIYLPKYMKASVSVDGVSWYQLGAAYNGADPADKNIQNVKLSLSFPSVSTRYVKISFPVNVWVFARHLTVKGGLPTEKPVVLASDSRDKSTENFLQDSEIKDILLVYTGDPKDVQTWSENDFQPLVSYTNRQGQIKDQMFDTMLFLPYNRLSCTSSGWEAYLNDLFAAGKNLHSVEEAVYKMNEATGLQRKEKIILTLPYPDPNQSSFGMESLTFTNKYVGNEQAAKNRFRAVQWFYSELLKKWNSAEFKNLDLAGIYWYKESIDTQVFGEEALLQNTSQMIRQDGYKFFWIPYYGALGYEDWRSFGFTHVFLQPNYYATKPGPEERMGSAADLARQYGTGIELELDNRVLIDPNYNALFNKELTKGHQLGLDVNTVNAYHVGMKGTLLDAAYSEFPEVRKVYDDLYRWIKGSYN